jgi:hypothetical protein
MEFEHYIAFRLEFDIIDNDPEYQYRMYISETPFKETDTAEELNEKMIVVTKTRWEETFKDCKQHFKNYIDNNREYFISCTTMTYGEILEQSGELIGGRIKIE